jgi:hypothetical protein
MSEQAGMDRIILNVRSEQMDSTLRYLKSWLGVLGLILLASSSAWSQDLGWPRQITKPGGTLVYYQP